jgi:hypothetical protein
MRTIPYIYNKKKKKIKVYIVYFDEYLIRSLVMFSTLAAKSFIQCRNIIPHSALHKVQAYQHARTQHRHCSQLYSKKRKAPKTIYEFLTKYKPLGHPEIGQSEAHLDTL